MWKIGGWCSLSCFVLWVNHLWKIAAHSFWELIPLIRGFSSQTQHAHGCTSMRYCGVALSSHHHRSCCWFICQCSFFINDALDCCIISIDVVLVPDFGNLLIFAIFIELCLRSTSKNYILRSQISKYSRSILELNFALTFWWGLLHWFRDDGKLL